MVVTAGDLWLTVHAPWCETGMLLPVLPLFVFKERVTSYAAQVTAYPLAKVTGVLLPIRSRSCPSPFDLGRENNG